MDRHHETHEIHEMIFPVSVLADFRVFRVFRSFTVRCFATDFRIIFPGRGSFGVP